MIIGITNDKYKIPFKISDCDSNILEYKWYAHFRHGRAHIESIIRTYRQNGKRVNQSLHSMIIGKIDKGMVIDHIDGDATNNTRENLRICTQSENAKNKKSWYKKVSVDSPNQVFLDI